MAKHQYFRKTPDSTIGGKSKRLLLRSQFDFAKKRSAVAKAPAPEAWVPLHHFSNDPFAPALSISGNLKVLRQP